MTVGCAICRDPDRREAVNRLIAQGFSPYKIELRSKGPSWKERGIRPVKQESVTRHIPHLMPEGLPDDMDKADRREVARLSARRETGVADAGDVAKLVQIEAIAGLKEGRLKVTTKDGLAAQAILDRRLEKAKGRELALELARLLHGGEIPEHVLPRNVTPVTIEGTVLELEP